MENYRGSLPYARYFKNELILRSISLDSMECGKLFCIYQSEKEKQRFYEHFEDINLSFYDIESYIQSRTTFYEPSTAEKIMMFNKAMKPSKECYSSFAATLKTMLNDVVPRAAVDSCLLMKLLNDAPQPIKEALVKHSSVTLEVFLREAKDHEDKQRVRLLFPRPSPENVDERRKEPKMTSPPQVVVPKKCYNCQQPGHQSPNCPLKVDPNPTTEAKLLSLSVENSQFCINEWNKAPLLFESFNFGPHQLAARIDSGAEINVLPAYMIDAYVNLGIDVRKVSQMVVSGVGKKNVVAVANLLICYIVTQKAVAVDVYFINDMTPLITVQTAHALGLSIDELTSQAIDGKIKLIQVLDDLNKSTFDESFVKLLCTRKYDEKSRYAVVYDMDYFANLANQEWDKLWLSKEGKKNSRNKVPARI
uniref:CCHC-type domain-containing protein n=1 Tax=Strongyloides papillosus TaxID=174720 RepID=A0A0N5BHM0_STREA